MKLYTSMGPNPAVVAMFLAEKGAQVGGLQRRDGFKAGSGAEMLGQESAELVEIAAIGFERLRRKPALMPEMGEPVALQGVEIAHRLCSHFAVIPGDRRGTRDPCRNGSGTDPGSAPLRGLSGTTTPDLSLRSMMPAEP